MLLKEEILFSSLDSTLNMEEKEKCHHESFLLY
jgi:hypothetical protein